MDLAEEALAAFDRGWVLTPMRGKQPVTKGWQKAPPPSRVQIAAWAPEGNLGLRTGKVSGVVVIDDDTLDGSGAEAIHLPKTVTVETGGGKRHYYFRCPDAKVGNSTSKLAPNVDVRGDGGVVVFPGSVHPDTGANYVWAEGLSPDEVSMAELPETLLQRLRRVAGKDRPGKIANNGSRPRSRANSWGSSPAEALREAVESVASASEGGRNSTLNCEAFRLGRLVTNGALTDGEVFDALLIAGVGNGLTDGACRATIRSGLDARARKAADGASGAHGRQETGDGSLSLEHAGPEALGGARSLNESGNAERLVRMFGESIRYCPTRKCWLVWNEKVWESDLLGRVAQMSKAVAKSIYEEAAQAIGDKETADTAKWAQLSLAGLRRRETVRLAQSEVGIPILEDALDRDPMLLSCLNGTLDLKTGKLREHRREDLITCMAPVEVDPKADCPHFKEFLDRIHPDASVRGYLQRVVGYCLTGDVSEQALFFFHGSGANGKSVLVSVIQGLLGRRLAITAEPKLLLASKFSEHTTGLADLRGARVAVTSEINEGRSLDAALVKQLTGCDEITARRMRENNSQFAPTHKLIVMANHKPLVDASDAAMWRRIHTVTFGVVIPEAEQDKHLKEKLLAELPGILNWALEGLRAWRAGGLAPPEAVLAAGQAYQREMDSVAQFCEEGLLGVPEQAIKATALYGAYVTWATARGERPKSQTHFGIELTRLGHEKTRRPAGYFYLNLALPSEPEADVHPCVPNAGGEGLNGSIALRRGSNRDLGTQGAQGFIGSPGDDGGEP